jgi:hypothetical protein
MAYLRELSSSLLARGLAELEGALRTARPALARGRGTAADGGAAEIGAPVGSTRDLTGSPAATDADGGADGSARGAAAESAGPTGAEVATSPMVLTAVEADGVERK